MARFCMSDETSLTSVWRGVVGVGLLELESQLHQQ